MISKLCFALTTVLVLALAVRLYSQQPQQQQSPQQQGMDCPLHQKHQNDQQKATVPADHDSHAEMEQRGDQGMGFSQSKTAHHFLLWRDGGAIEVAAKDPADKASRDEIRQHLTHIAHAFAEGNFDLPMFIHAQTPPGVPVMKRLRAEISYELEQTERGARVLIRTRNAEALAAIHDFLRFQIEEHRTGDPLEVNGQGN
jgi:hypothetical protein